MSRSSRVVSNTFAVLLVCVAVVVVPLAVLVRVRWAGLEDVDARIDDAVHGFVLRHPAVGDVSGALTHLGDPVVVTVAAFVLAAVLAALRRWRAAVYVLVVRAVALIVGSATKEIVDRARPDLPHPVAHARGPSFPSGHSIGSAALWASIAVLVAVRTPRPVAVAVAVAVPLVVGVTRVLLGVHFVSDVVAGWVLGFVCAIGVADVMRIRERHVEERSTGGAA